MREIRVTSDISMRVFNENPNDTALAREAVFIVPYSTISDFLKPVQVSDHNKILVVHSGVIGALKVARKGVYGSGYGAAGSSIKYGDIRSKRDVQGQVDGYLALLAVTEGQPVSVVQVENPNSLPPHQFITDVLRAYKNEYVRENLAELEKDRLASEPKVRKAYSPFSLDGLRRLLKGTNCTVYFGARREIIDMVGDMTHPEARKMYV